MAVWRIAAVAAALALAPANAHAIPPDVTGSGSGFFINADGWLVTNAHVLEGCARVSVPSLGELTDWKVDKENDLAAAHLIGKAPRGCYGLVVKRFQVCGHDTGPQTLPVRRFR